MAGGYWHISEANTEYVGDVIIHPGTENAFTLNSCYKFTAPSNVEAVGDSYDELEIKVRNSKIALIDLPAFSEAGIMPFVCPVDPNGVDTSDYTVFFATVGEADDVSIPELARSVIMSAETK